LKRSNSFVLTAVLTLVLFLPLQGFAADPLQLRVVLVPERNIFNQQAKYMNVCDFVCSVIDVTLNFRVLKNYGEVMSALEGGEAEIGVLGSFLMLHGITNHDFVPIARPVWNSGESTYSSVIFSRVGSGVTKDVRTWRGKSLVYANRHTSAGYYYPLYVLKIKGVKTKPEKYFSVMNESGSHDAALWMVSNGLADVGAAKNTVFFETMEKNPELEDMIEILYVGGKFPDATFAVTSKVGSFVRNSLQRALLDMHNHPEGRRALDKFGAKKFIPSDIKDYDTVMVVVDGAGFDIEKIIVADHRKNIYRKKDSKP